MSAGGLRASAVLSDDGLYRYELTRTWSSAPSVSFVMLNPSTADASLDDPTIRRCIGFARSWGHGGIRVVNLYALRSTDPKALWGAPDPVGPDNDEYLRRAAVSGGPLIAAWGGHARADRVAAVLALPGLEALQALGVTKAGQPRHPLYLRGDAAPSPWPTVGGPDDGDLRRDEGSIQRTDRVRAAGTEALNLLARH